MALRILTGIIVPSTPNGDVTIQFHPHDVTGIDGTGIEMAVVGAAGTFRGPPAKVIAIRQIDDAAGGLDDRGEDFSLSDSELTKHRVVVSWRSPKNMQIREISYLVAGEV